MDICNRSGRHSRHSCAGIIIAMVIIIILVVGVVAIVSTPKPSPSPYYITETLQHTPTPELYVKLSVEADETEHHWTRDSSTDLPCCIRTIVYTVSNDGTAYASNVGVIITLPAASSSYQYFSFSSKLSNKQHTIHVWI